MSAILLRAVSSSVRANHQAQAACGLFGGGGRRYSSSKENQAAKRALLASKTVQKNYLSDPRFNALVNQCLRR